MNVSFVVFPRSLICYGTTNLYFVLTKYFDFEQMLLFTHTQKNWLVPMRLYCTHTPVAWRPNICWNRNAKYCYVSWHWQWAQPIPVIVPCLIYHIIRNLMCIIKIEQDIIYLGTFLSLCTILWWRFKTQTVDALRDCMMHISPSCTASTLHETKMMCTVTMYIEYSCIHRTVGLRQYFNYCTLIGVIPLTACRPIDRSKTIGSQDVL